MTCGFCQPQAIGLQAVPLLAIITVSGQEHILVVEWRYVGWRL